MFITFDAQNAPGLQLNKPTVFFLRISDNLEIASTARILECKFPCSSYARVRYVAKTKLLRK